MLDLRPCGVLGARSSAHCSRSTAGPHHLGIVRQEMGVLTLASATTSFTQPAVQDPLMYLPCAPILEYRRGSCIYAQDEPSSGLYLIIAGTVKVCRVTDEGCESVTDIYIQDEFFGESALLGSAGSREMAVA